MKSYITYIWDSKWVLSLSAGVLLGISFPPFPLPLLMFIAFILLFRLIDLSETAGEAAYISYPGFVIWNLIATYWLMLATPAGGIAAILANSAVMTLPVMLQHKIMRQDFSPWLTYILTASFWISYEYLHHHWDLAWPWLTLGNAWSNVPSLIQYISVTGYWGISLWILLVCGFAYHALKHRDQLYGVISVTLLVIFPVVSLLQLAFQSEPEVNATVETVVVQPDFDSYARYGGFSSPRQANEHLIGLIDTLRTPNTQLVVWPENAIQADISNRDNFSDVSGDTKMQLFQKAREWQSTLIAGATYFEYYNRENAPVLPYVSGQRQYLPFNAALAFQPDQTLDVYRKHNLVPIVERMPFVHALDVIDLFDWVSWTDIQGYGKGYEGTQFNVADTQTPALICYDSVFPGWVGRFVRHGAGFLTIITNDGWWGDTSGHEQHFSYARLRAIEFNRWVVRSANNGISGIIAPDGSVEVETSYRGSTAFRYNVPVLSGLTFYARFGDWLPVLMLILSGMGVFRLVYPPLLVKIQQE